MANNYNDTGSSQLYAMDRMKEMEEEMSRFEEEILGRNAHGDADAVNHLQGGGKPFPFPFPSNNHDGEPNSSIPQAKFPGQESLNYRPTGPAGFPPQPMVPGHGHPNQRMPGPPGMRPPGIRMGGPSGIRMGGPPGVPSGPGPRQMRPSFIPHQLQRGSQPGMSHPMQAPHMVPPRARMNGPRGMMPMPMMPMKPTTISAAPTVYSAKPVKFDITEEKLEEKEKPAETSAVVETNSAVQQQSIQSHQPVNDTMMYQPHAMKQQQQDAARAGQEAVPSAAAKKTKKKKFIRTAAGQNWEDESLLDWDSNDFRIFCGDLGNEVNDDTLTKAFNRYPSFIKAKVVRDKRNGKSKGYGFVSFKDPNDFVQAMREMNGKYVGNRPIKLRKSMWKERNVETAKKKMREKQRLGLR